MKRLGYDWCSAESHMFPIVEAKGIPRVPERIYEDNSRREVPWHNGDDGSEETHHPEHVQRNRVMSGRRDNCSVLSEIGFKRLHTRNS